MFCYSLHHQYWKSIIFQQNLVMVTLTNLDSFTAMNVLSSAGVDAIMVSAHFRSTKFQDWAFLYNLVVVYPSKMKLFSFQIDKIFKKQVFLQLICLLVLWIRIILWKLRWKKILNIPISKSHLEKNHILSVKKCISDDLHLLCSLTNCYWH